MGLLKETHLVLFFMRGNSLRLWDTFGLLDREVRLYRELLPHLRSITFVTHGDIRDRRYTDRLNGIRLVCDAWRYPKIGDALGLVLGFGDEFFLLPKLHLLNEHGPMVIKSDQVKGAYIALKAARLFRKKFIARCGYLHSEFMERAYGPNSPRVQRARRLERKIFTAADRVVVTAPTMRQIVVQRYQVPAECVKVIPNYIETERFRPISNQRSQLRRICFVGRLEREKNLFALLQSLKGLDVELVLVGNGSLLERLREEANSTAVSVRFLGNVQNRRLPDILNSSTLFILPSFHEGQPKALLEAMACGLPVIGTNVPGIREVIRHRETGFLCGTTPGEIRAAIQNVLSDAKLRDRMGSRARQFIVEQCALDKVVKMELAILEEVLRE
jgi:glycosyltransferase involved in cell wall biosynthesis